MNHMPLDWPTPTLQPGERKLVTYRAGRSTGTQTVDGELVLTDRRLIFSAREPDAARRHGWECTLSSIEDATALSRGSNPLQRSQRRIRIDGENTSEFFVVDNGPAIVWAIADAASGGHPDVAEVTDEPDAVSAGPRRGVVAAVLAVVLVALVLGGGAWWLIQRPLQPSQEIVIDDHDVKAIEWSPNGDVVAIAATEFGVWDLDSERRTASGDRELSAVTDLAWSPDGNQLAITHPFDHLEVLDIVDGDRPAAQWRREPGGAEARERGYLALAWSPDGSEIAAVVRSPDQSRGALEVLDATTGEVVAELAGPQEIYDVAWSPDGSQLATVEPYGRLRLWDADTLEPETFAIDNFANEERFITAVAWHPRSRLIAVGTSNGTIQVWDTTRRTPPMGIGAHVGDVADLSWSPDGALLASSGRDDAIRLWRADGTQAGRDRSGHGVRETFVTWSPDGERLASASDGLILVWDDLR